ncbi:MAG TPA: hypothetical protein PLX04_08470 [Caldisericia bacterium]|nr:hypothetical protein [Caldisericia bacterium]HOU08864.1 hypothetical protein [Caldisericia bacterium]HPL90271.1 hypothetical protein [Caldisericia bacterium]HQG60239.1 hypothetical protein [Caldisericia bacterium]HQH48457.1 hypothetical protein [Caldisericia bacterium]
MKKIALLVAVCITVCFFASCGGSATSNDVDIYVRLDMAKRLLELVDFKFGKMAPDQACIGVLSILKADYSKVPSSLYEDLQKTLKDKGGQDFRRELAKAFGEYEGKIGKVQDAIEKETTIATLSGAKSFLVANETLGMVKGTGIEEVNWIIQYIKHLPEEITTKLAGIKNLAGYYKAIDEFIEKYR